MIIVISPAKTLNARSSIQLEPYSQPVFLEEAQKIVSVLKKKKPQELVLLMDISPKLAELNAHRYQLWQPPFTLENSFQALLMFNGDVYQEMKAATFSPEQFEYAQQNLRILSGVYGLLKPLDLIQPYRLEMGISISIGNKKDLYDFWKTKITNRLKSDLEQGEKQLLINLASNEYFSAIDTKKLKARIITPTFKESRNGQYQMISIFAKKARGMMCRFIIENQITDPEEIKAFDVAGYYFNNSLSKENEWVFTR
ncbi:MAG: peroxide stress protein YaaA [Candidatus Saccharibacteria bacterium]